MERVYTNKECPLYDTVYCERLNMLKCEVCPANRDKSQAERVREDLNEIAALLPAEDYSALFHSESCVLCKDKPNPRACYAIADLGHAKPAREGRNFLGMKTKLRMGSMLPVQMSCCAACRRKFQKLTYLHILLPLFVAAVTLALLSVASIREGLAGAHVVLPLIVFILAVGGAYLLGLILEARLHKRYEQETYLNILEQPTLAEMAKLGWFEVQKGKGVSQLIFAKERLKQGLYPR